MSKTTFLRVLGLAFVLLAPKAIVADTTRIAGVENHWVANSGGTLAGHIQNFLTDMVVYYNANAPADNPLILAGSFWDEGGYGYGAYARGQSMGKAEWWKDTIHSDRAWYKGQKCQINHFWGRAFTGNTAPPPTGDSAPFVSCSTGDTIRSIVDPTAVTFDRTGHLLVADNGPDQNVKIFSLNPPRLIRTFGDSGGVFARSKPGASPAYIPGATGPRRFWGIRGLAVDTQGNLYVGNTGMPEQTMGGTDIRGFSAVDSSTLWQVQGLSFVNDADADPASNGKDLYLNAKHFRMDYSKAPGKSWTLAGVTLNPFQYSDPRLTIPMESVWERRIGGKRFQYHTNMYGDFVYVIRFNDSSEIGIPTAYYCLNADRQTGWGTDSAPTWTRNETNKRIRWFWVDRNGDGIPQKGEYGTYDNYNCYSQAIDVDENGDIWLGGSGKVDRFYGAGGLLHIPAGGLDANGVPKFPLKPDSRFSVPFTENSGAVTRVKFLANKDAAFLTTSKNSWYSSAIYRYDHFSDTTRQQQTCRIDLGYNDNGAASIDLDQNSATMTLPWSFTADSDFVYVTYLDRGRYSRARGEVTVYDARDCHTVGWIGPGPETGGFAGAADIVNALNVVTQADGTKLLMVEEDGAGKVMVYRWMPQRATTSILSTTTTASPIAKWTSDRRLVLTGIGEHGWVGARLLDPSGRTLNSWNLGGPAKGTLELPAARIHSFAVGFLILESNDGTTLRLRIPPIF